MDDLNLYRLASSCLLDNMQFRQHYARDKRNANFDHYFWHKAFVEMKGPVL